MWPPVFQFGFLAQPCATSDQGTASYYELVEQEHSAIPR